MYELNIERRTMGLCFNKEGIAEITVWAPDKKNVSIAPDNGNILALRPYDFGYWHTTVPDLKPGDLYKINIDGNHFPDPASLSQPDGVHDFSCAVDSASFHWNDDSWNNIPLENYIIYEIHTGTFSPEGTFEGIVQKLDYITKLGITAIELMPVAQFPGTRNWGYDGVFPFAVQNSYGGADGLLQLIDACHEKGLAVILDVVYNHLGPEGNYLGAFGPYFTDKYNTPWGQAVNFDDAYCDGVRRYVTENVLMWFRDFHVDALRLDAVHAIKDFSPVHILKEIREQVDKLMLHTGKSHYLIVECDLNDPRFINSTAQNGYGMDAQWMDEFHHALRVATGEPRKGYFADFNGLEHLAKAFKDAYVYNGQYSSHRYRKFGAKATNKGSQFVIFSQNHDQVGNRMLGERIGTLVSFEMQKLVAATVMVAPFIPMLFMGEEYAEIAPFLYFVSHSDPELIEAVRRGRKAEFSAFHINGEAPDPQAEESFLRSKLDWKLPHLGVHIIMLEYYRELIRFRKTHPVFSKPGRDNLETYTDQEKKVLELHRWHGEDHVYCMMNFSQEVQSVRMKYITRTSFLIWNSAALKWNGVHDGQQTVYPGNELHVPPESILIYSNR